MKKNENMSFNDVVKSEKKVERAERTSKGFKFGGIVLAGTFALAGCFLPILFAVAGAGLLISLGGMLAEKAEHKKLHSLLKLRHEIENNFTQLDENDFQPETRKAENTNFESGLKLQDRKVKNEQFENVEKM